MDRLSHDLLGYLFSFIPFPGLFRLSHTCRKLHHSARDYLPWKEMRIRMVKVLKSRDWITASEAKWICGVVHAHDDIPLLELILKEDPPQECESRISIAYEFFAEMGREDLLLHLARHQIPTATTWTKMLGAMCRAGLIPFVDKYLKTTTRPPVFSRFSLTLDMIGSCIKSACKCLDKKKRKEIMTLLYSRSRDFVGRDLEISMIYHSTLRAIVKTKKLSLFLRHKASIYELDPIAVWEAAARAGWCELFDLYEGIVSSSLQGNSKMHHHRLLANAIKGENLYIIERCLKCHISPPGLSLYTLLEDPLFDRKITWPVWITKLIVSHHPTAYSQLQRRVGLSVAVTKLETLEYLNMSKTMWHTKMMAFIAFSDASGRCSIIRNVRFKLQFYLSLIIQNEAYELLEEALWLCNTDEIYQTLKELSLTFPIYANEDLTATRNRWKRWEGGFLTASQVFPLQNKNSRHLAAGLKGYILAAYDHVGDVADPTATCIYDYLEAKRDIQNKKSGYRKLLAQYCMLKRVAKFLGIDDFPATIMEWKKQSKLNLD